MSWDEIEVPKEIRPFMLEHAEETKLGQQNGAKKQYRYGNLHIREYNDKYLVHTDRVDPRKDPVGHLIFDAPEVLIGLATTVLASKNISSQIYKIQKDPKSKNLSLITGFLVPMALGYLGYSLTKKIKNLLE